MSNLTRNTITSMEVAEMVGKEHSKLLRDIRNYVSQLAEAKIGLGDFFTEATYKDANNQNRPCFQVTKKGCEFIAHKLTGQKALEVMYLVWPWSSNFLVWKILQRSKPDIIAKGSERELRSFAIFFHCRENR